MINDDITKVHAVLEKLTERFRNAEWCVGVALRFDKRPCYVIIYHNSVIPEGVHIPAEIDGVKIVSRFREIPKAL
jgi:hypothetical protein